MGRARIRKISRRVSRTSADFLSQSPGLRVKRRGTTLHACGLDPPAMVIYRPNRKIFSDECAGLVKWKVNLLGEPSMSRKLQHSVRSDPTAAAAAASPVNRRVARVKGSASPAP